MSKEDLVEYCAPSMEHPVAIVLGSGLGALADRVKVVRRIPYEDIAFRRRRSPSRAIASRCWWAPSTVSR